MTIADAETADASHVADMPRIVVRPTDGAGAELAAPTAFRAPIDTTVELGREADIAVGVDPHDAGISRVALTVRATPNGWQLRMPNRNGAVIHAWAQPPVWVSGGGSFDSAWPRIAVRLTGSDPDAILHWVLLEYDPFATLAHTRAHTDTTVTVYADRPDPLTAPQLDALTELFNEHLMWPPSLGPKADSLKRVARRLGVGQTAVSLRLQGAQDRAYQLGSPTQVGVTEPDYFYTLVRHGFVPWPTERCKATGIDLQLD